MFRPRKTEVSRVALETLAIHPGHFSEALLVAPHASGVVRLVFDPFTYWLLTSDARDLAALAAIDAGGVRDTADLLREAARRHPHGAMNAS